MSNLRELCKPIAYQEMKTIADWNWWFGMNGTEPYTIVGITTQTGKKYCAKCTSHVNVFELGEGVSPIYKDDNFQGTCFGCENKIED